MWQLLENDERIKGITMTELKRICPFCGGEMIGTTGHPICHYNPDCIIYDESVPQELLDLLADTKKKLDICVDGITYMRNNCLDYAADYMDYADGILEQINNKEQKDK